MTDISASDIIRQFDSISSQLSGQQVVGVFPYSSLDLDEFPLEARQHIYSTLESIPSLRYVLLEATAELVTTRALSEAASLLPSKNVVIFLGVETSNDFIRRYCVNKSYAWEHMIEAVQIIHSCGMQAHAFLLLKLPFLTEEESVHDALQSVRDCLAAGFDGVLLTGVEIAKHSLTEILMARGLYEKFRPLSLVTVMAHLPASLVGRTTVTSFTELELSSEEVGDHGEIDQESIDMARSAVEAFNRLNVPPRSVVATQAGYAGVEPVPVNTSQLRQRLMRYYRIVIDELTQRRSVKTEQ